MKNETGAERQSNGAREQEERLARTSEGLAASGIKGTLLGELMFLTAQKLYGVLPFFGCEND